METKQKKKLFVTEKFNEKRKKNSKCFSGGCLKFKIAILLKRVKLVGLCCETWLKEEFELREKRMVREKKMFGSWVTPLVGRHVVNDSKIAGNVGCHVANELGIF